MRLSIGEARHARLLEVLERVVRSHPFVTRKIYAAFVAEGRRYVETNEGQAMARRLVDAEPVAQGRVLWELLNEPRLGQASVRTMPSHVLEGFAKLASDETVQSLLHRLKNRKAQ